MVYGRTGAFSVFSKISLFSRLGTTTKAMIVPVSGHPSRTSSNARGAGGGHRSHPQDTRRAADAISRRRRYKPPGPTGRQRASTTSHHQPTQPTTVTPGGVGTPWMPRRAHCDLVRGRRDPIPADLYCSGAVCPFFRDITYLISFLDGLKVLKRSGALRPMGLWKDSF